MCGWGSRSRSCVHVRVSQTRTVRKLKSSLPPRRIAATQARPERQAPAAAPETDADGAGEDAPDKHSMCVDILVSGHVQSYVDFFYLTHRPDPNPGAYCGTRSPACAGRLAASVACVACAAGRRCAWLHPTPQR